VQVSEVRRTDLDIAIPFAAPRSDIEQLMCRLMADALELDAVGIDDDFFRLGGDSLAAERLFLAIEETIARRLPLASLYDCPTVRLLAEMITTGNAARSWSMIVKIRDRGAKPPIFIVPGVGGEVIGMGRLAQHLDGDRPVYCCHFIGLDPSEMPVDSIEDMATSFLPEIRRMQPAGPYHLLGACFGGLVALELAQRLRAEGEEVGLLCLADTPLPDFAAAGGNRRLPVGLQFVLDRMKFFARELAGRGRGERFDFVRGKARRIVSVVQSGSLPPDVKVEIAKRRVIEANRTAARRYVPRPYGGAAIYVRSANRPSGPLQARRMSWQGYFPAGLAMHAVECRDSGELFGPHVGDLAAILSAVLHDPPPAGVKA